MGFTRVKSHTWKKSFISPFIVIADQCPTSPGRFQYYNGDTKVCCNGTLYDRNKDSKEEVGCCGGKRKREREKYLNIPE